jgi:predicted DNA-binding transcriptional regulator YafY
MRDAIRSRRVLRLDYQDLRALRSQREVRPLACSFWGGTWTLAAWCELREDFRTFRLDRILGMETATRTFADEPGKTWPDYVRLMEQEGST